MICSNLMALAHTGPPTYPFPFGMEQPVAPTPDPPMFTPSEVSPAPLQPTNVGTGPFVGSNPDGTAVPDEFYPALIAFLTPAPSRAAEDMSRFDDTFFDIDAASSDNPPDQRPMMRTPEDTSRLQILAVVAEQELERVERDKSSYPYLPPQTANNGGQAGEGGGRTNIRAVKTAKPYDLVRKQTQGEGDTGSSFHESESTDLGSVETDVQTTDTEKTKHNRKGNDSDATISESESASSDSDTIVVAMPAANVAMPVADFPRFGRPKRTTRKNINYAE